MRGGCHFCQMQLDADQMRSEAVRCESDAWSDAPRVGVGRRPPGAGSGCGCHTCQMQPDADQMRSDAIRYSQLQRQQQKVQNNFSNL